MQCYFNVQQACVSVCQVPLGGGKEQWYSFNDDLVVKMPAANIVTPSAYILFYARHD
jgi:ubiquitin C-terminal hydrolase